MKFGTILRIVGRRDIEKPEPKLPHRGGGLLEKPTPAPTGDMVPEKWEPPTKGTTVADRKRIRRRAARAARAARRAERLA